MASKKEVWKMIEAYPNYEVSNKGRVRNVQSGKVLAIDSKNAVTLYDYGMRQHLSVRTLVNYAF